MTCWVYPKLFSEDVLRVRCLLEYKCRSIDSVFFSLMRFVMNQNWDSEECYMLRLSKYWQETNDVTCFFALY